MGSHTAHGGGVKTDGRPDTRARTADKTKCHGAVQKSCKSVRMPFARAPRNFRVLFRICICMCARPSAPPPAFSRGGPVSSCDMCQPRARCAGHDKRGKRRGRQQYLPKSSEFKVEQRRDRSGTEVPKAVCLMFPMPLPVPRHVSDVYVFTASLRIHTLQRATASRVVGVSQCSLARPN